MKFKISYSKNKHSCLKSQMQRSSSILQLCDCWFNSSNPDIDNIIFKNFRRGTRTPKKKKNPTYILGHSCTRSCASTCCGWGRNVSISLVLDFDRLIILHSLNRCTAPCSRSVHDPCHCVPVAVESRCSDLGQIFLDSGGLFLQRF